VPSRSIPSRLPAIPTVAQWIQPVGTERRIADIVPEMGGATFSLTPAGRTLTPLPRNYRRPRFMVARTTRCSPPGEVAIMVEPSTAATTVDDSSAPSAIVGGSAARRQESAPVCSGRGVLDGAFVVLEVLACADEGLGLSALARTSGLAKTSAYRLAEQLVDLGAVKRVEHRYYLGPLIGRLGQRWEPDPILRQAGQSSVHTLAVRSGGVASLRILHEDRLRSVCTTVRHDGHAYIPHPADAESTARTATGRVLYAAGPVATATLPASWAPREWRRLRESIRDLDATVVDCQDAFPGICCVSAPVWWPNGTCAGAVTALLPVPAPTPALRGLVLRAARQIEGGLRRS
jgi:IclR family acetate operon transcriptional repressor